MFIMVNATSHSRRFREMSSAYFNLIFSNLNKLYIE